MCELSEIYYASEIFFLVCVSILLRTVRNVVTIQLEIEMHVFKLQRMICKCESQVYEQRKQAFMFDQINHSYEYNNMQKVS